MYAQTANVRKNVEEILKRREITISSLITSYDAYEDLLAKSSKGLEFYRKLEINVSKLLQRVKSTCKVQEEEREQILAQDSKNTYEKTDSTTPSTYDQGRPPRSNGLKLKDYLNNRIESGTGYQNPYYNLYKGHVTAMQVDSKTLATDVTDKTLIQSPGTIPAASEISSSSMKSSQHYYPTTYADYRSTGSPYSYNTQNYYENPINSVMSQNYLPTTSTIATNVYQQPIFSASSANASTSGVQYPASSYLSNGQTASSNGQDKYRSSSQSAYNVSNSALQYDAYHQPVAGYNSYNVVTPYAPNQDKAAAAVKSGTPEILSQVQVQQVSQIPVSMIGVPASVTMPVDGQAHTSYSVVQQDQQYNNQQKTVLPGQEISHGGQSAVKPQPTLLTKDNTPIQSYSLPQAAGQAEMAYPQNYPATAYYNPAELQATQRVPFTHGTYDTTQYMQSQQPSTSNQPMHSATSASEISAASYASNLQTGVVNPTQYPQQTSSMDQGKQTYADNTYASYGTTQVQMNQVTPSYPSTYQNYQHGATTAMPYQQQTGIQAADASNAYAYLNNSSSSEMIQSHAKPTTVQSYSQSYQYSHQDAYPSYMQYPSYSQAQSYTYMQQPGGHGTMTYTYNHAGQAQGYAAYAANSAQTTQASQTLEAAVSMPSVSVTATATAGYQQQETNARYTNAGNNAVVTQTASSQYSQVPQSQAENDTYYTTPYGLQMQQGQGSSMLKYLAEKGCFSLRNTS